MRTFRCLSVVAVLLLSTSSAFAAGLSITAADIIWNPPVDGTPSGYMKIEILNDGVTDLLSTWTLDLTLQQVSGTGTLKFNSGSIAALGSSYLLDGKSFSPSVTTTDSSIYAYDLYPPGAPFGVPVPASGKYLLAVNFTTDDNAKGVWNLMTSGGPVNSFWAGPQGGYNETAFTNVPFDSGSVAIGQITVIPEPTTFALALLGGVVFACSVYRQRRGVASIER